MLNNQSQNAKPTAIQAKNSCTLPVRGYVMVIINQLSIVSKQHQFNRGRVVKSAAYYYDINFCVGYAKPNLLNSNLMDLHVPGFNVYKVQQSK